jgi:hypothetical protein
LERHSGNTGIAIDLGTKALAGDQSIDAKPSLAVATGRRDLADVGIVVVQKPDLVDFDLSRITDWSEQERGGRGRCQTLPVAALLHMTDLFSIGANCPEVDAPGKQAVPTRVETCHVALVATS